MRYICLKQHMGMLDIIIGGLLAVGFVLGWKNGFFVEITSVIAVIVALYGTIHFSYLLGDYLGEKLQWDASYIKITAFILTFIAILVGVHLLAKVLTRVAKFTMLGLLNRLAGGVFGLVKVAVILGALLAFLERANQPLDFIEPEIFEESIFYEPLKETGSFTFARVLEPELLEEYLP